jgi:hypothetical protein
MDGPNQGRDVNRRSMSRKDPSHCWQRYFRLPVKRIANRSRPCRRAIVRLSEPHLGHLFVTFDGSGEPGINLRFPRDRRGRIPLPKTTGFVCSAVTPASFFLRPNPAPFPARSNREASPSLHSITDEPPLCRPRAKVFDFSWGELAGAGGRMRLCVCPLRMISEMISEGVHQRLPFGRA